MNDLLNDIGKKMPYQESKDYLDRLLEQAAQKAIMHEHKRKSSRRLAMMIISAAAVVLLVVGIGLSVTGHGSKTVIATQQVESPMDQFLNSLSEEELSQLPYYEIEEIPEY